MTSVALSIIVDICWPANEPFCCACVHQSDAGPVTDYVRGEDVLDIWFDSGASWAAVLEGTKVSPVCPAHHHTK